MLQILLLVSEMTYYVLGGRQTLLTLNRYSRYYFAYILWPIKLCFRFNSTL